MGMEKFDMHAQLYEAQKRFHRACVQINHLNDKLENLQRRYVKAKSDDDKFFRYSLRMRLLTVEGIIKCYCQYACLKKNEVLDLRFKLFGEAPDEGETIYGGVDDDDDDEGYSGVWTADAFTNWRYLQNIREASDALAT